MKYREGALYSYSGTSNSHRVTAWMADALRDAGGTVRVRSIQSAQPSQEIGRGDKLLLGLVMPTHGFTAPWAMIRFALGLPRRRNTHAFVVATRAGAKIGPTFTPGFEGSATLLVALVLALKGYQIRGTAGIDMPSNWIALHPGLSPETVRDIVARAKARAVPFVTTILSGGRRLTGSIASLLRLLVLPISLGYLLIGRFYLAKLLFASHHCTGCALCAKHCPNRAIEMRGRGKHARPYWTFRCESCMRCMAYCPVNAVEASHLLAVGTYLLAGGIPTAAAVAWLAARVPLLAPLSRTPHWLLFWGSAVFAIGPLYWLFHLLLRVKWVNRFFSCATLTHYYRRYHEPETALEDLDPPCASQPGR